MVPFGTYNLHHDFQTACVALNAPLLFPFSMVVMCSVLAPLFSALVFLVCFVPTASLFPLFVPSWFYVFCYYSLLSMCRLRPRHGYQRLSHACLSIGFYAAKLRMAHSNSYSLFDSHSCTLTCRLRPQHGIPSSWVCLLTRRCLSSPSLPLATWYTYTTT